MQKVENCSFQIKNLKPKYMGVFKKKVLTLHVLSDFQ